MATEKKLPDFQPGPCYKEDISREKHKYSYFFSAWRIDVSTVVTRGRRKQKQAGQEQMFEGDFIEQSYEVELELDSTSLRKNLAAKRNGQPHFLWQLLSDFLRTGRDLAAFAAELQPLRLPPRSRGNEEQVKDGNGDLIRRNQTLSRKFSGCPKPVVGHYIYRLAEEALQQELPVLPPVVPAASEAAVHLDEHGSDAEPLCKRPRLAQDT